jgi:hypothetical protein
MTARSRLLHNRADPGDHGWVEDACCTFIIGWAQIRSHLAAFCAEPAIMTGGRCQ